MMHTALCETLSDEAPYPSLCSRMGMDWKSARRCVPAGF
jgi:hypothetical protein